MDLEDIVVGRELDIKVSAALPTVIATTYGYEEGVDGAQVGIDDGSYDKPSSGGGGPGNTGSGGNGPGSGVGGGDTTPADEDVIPSPGVTKIVGSGGTYSSDAAIYGGLGVVFSPDSPGQLQYANPNQYESAGRVYFIITDQGSSNVLTVIRWSTGSGNGVFGIGVNSSNGFSIIDASGLPKTSTSTKTWEVGDKCWMEWKLTYDGTMAHITLRAHVGVDDVDPEEISRDVYTDAAIGINLGVPSSQSGWGFYGDTLTLVDSSRTWLGQYKLPPSGVQKILSWVGSPDGTGFVVSSNTSGFTSVKVGVSTTADMSTPTLSAGQTPSANGWTRHVITGLSPDTVYYYQLYNDAGSPVPVGEIRQTNTAPAVGALGTQRWAVVCCQRNHSDEGRVHQDILQNFNPHGVLHLGDMHYKGVASTNADKHAAIYLDQITNSAGLQDLCSSVGMYYMVSSNECIGNNADTGEDTDGGAATAANIAAYKQIVPYRALADTATHPRGRYQTWVVGRVRYIMLDTKNLDRSPGAPEDFGDGAKKMLGDDQLAWLLEQLQETEPLKVVISDVQWAGDDGQGPYSKPNMCKWWAYPTERDTIAEFIRSNLTTDGQPIRVDFWGGDEHMLGVSKGPKNLWGSFPMLSVGPIDQTPLAQFLSRWDQTWTGGQAHGQGTSQVNLAQYMRVEINDDGNTITRTATGVDCTTGAVGIVQQTVSWSVASTAGEIFALSGNHLQDGWTTVGQAGGVDTVKLAISTSEDMSSPTLTDAATPDDYGFVHFDVDDMDAGTDYWCALADGTTDDVFGSVMHIRTVHADADPFELRIGLGSCQCKPGTAVTTEDGAPLEYAWVDMTAFNPDIVFHVGDWGYYGGSIQHDDPWTKHADKFTAQLAGFQHMRDLLHKVAFFYEVSDHETANNGDRNDLTINEAAIAAYTKVAPVRAFADDSDPIDGRWFSWTYGPNIKFIQVDFRNNNRTLESTHDPGTWTGTGDGRLADKTGFGHDQYMWLLDELATDEALKIIVSEGAWYAAPAGHPSADKWWNYATEQQLLADYIAAHDIVTEWWGGDRHYISYTSAETAAASGLPYVGAQIVGSCFEQHSLGLAHGELYDYIFGNDPNKGDGGGSGDDEGKIPNVAWCAITLSDDKEGNIVRTVDGRAVTDTSIDPLDWQIESQFFLTDNYTYTP